MTAPRGLTGEWQVGWRIVAASAVANATGIALMFLTFNLFLLPMTADLGLTRAQAGVLQSLVVLAALGSPVIGWLSDRFGFRPVFILSTLALGGIELGVAAWGTNFAVMAAAIALIGFIGGGAAGVLIVRPVSTHFTAARGLALGLVGAGLSLSAMVAPPWLEAVVAQQGWQAGFRALAGIALLIGLPLVLLLMPRAVALHGAAAGAPAADHSFVRRGEFWKLALANMAIAVPVSGSIGHLSPMLQEHGLSPQTAALGLSSFAAGQLIGKLGSGWLLDRFEARRVAVCLNIGPALAFALLLFGGDQAAVLLLATALLGALQGADIGLFPYLVAQRFAMGQFGAVLGSIHGMGWIGTAAGLICFGYVFDTRGSYALVQALAIVALALASVLLLWLRPAERAPTD